MKDKLSIDKIRKLMDSKDHIRNMSIIAHVDHGKTTLSDALIQKAGISAQERWIDRVDPQQLERIITIKSTGVSLYFELAEKLLPERLRHPKEKDKDSIGGNGFLINMIDSPGHVDFSSEVTAALRLTDGALVVVDVIEGVAVQTKTVLRQAMAEKVKPILIINKLDRAILEKKFDTEATYKVIQQRVDGVNSIVAAYDDGESMKDMYLDPSKGNVAFGSGKYRWGFNIAIFARFYAAKTGKSEAWWAKKLWGEHFWDDKAQKIVKSKKRGDGTVLPRTFCKFILDPVFAVIKGCMDDREKPRRDEVDETLRRFGVPIIRADRDLEGKELMQAVMPRWLNAADALLEMMAHHLPSPAEAQAYRAANLYTGPKDDRYYKAVEKCDPAGPLMLYISKMVPSGKGRFKAFGRVFSGTVRPGMKVNIMGANHTFGGKEDLFCNKAVRNIEVGVGSIFLNVDSCPAGNTIMISGVDTYLLKSGTIVDAGAVDAYPLRNMKFSVTPVVRVAVKAKNASKIKQLNDALQSLIRTDPLCQVNTTEAGEITIAGAGELHIEILMKALREAAGVELIQSEPVVSFRETVSEGFEKPILVKSTNKHNRLFLKAQPMEKGLLDLISEGKIGPMTDLKERAELMRPYGFDLALTKKIWAFGPDEKGPNLLIDNTRGVAYLQSIKDSVRSGLQWASREGALCGEPMRGVFFSLEDAKLHADAVHRGQGQVLPTARRGFLGAQLSASPQLMEPVFDVIVTTPPSGLKGMWSVITGRRGSVLDQEEIPGSPLLEVHAQVPVVESFGLDAAMKTATSGEALSQMAFSHWAVLPGDPRNPDSLAGKVVAKTRARKGMSGPVPGAEYYIDKM